MSAMNDKFDVVSYGRVGCINFGDTRDEIFNKLGQPSESFRKFKEETFPRDIYSNLGLYITYSSTGFVEFIEAIEPATPMLHGINLLDPNYKQTIASLQKMGFEFHQDASGYESRALGIGFYIPDDELANVCFFRKGYYDEYNAKNGPQK